MDKRTTLVAFLLDETGSMESVKDQTISGFNEYIASLKKDDADICLFTLTRFNSAKCETPFNAAPVGQVTELTDKSYRPDAMTPLYDAIGRTITETEETLKTQKVHRILFVIQSDGLENASREYTLEAIRKAITQKEALGTWSFVYLGADQNAWSVAGPMGVQASNTVSYASAKTRETIHMVSDSTHAYRANASLQTGDADGGFWKGKTPPAPSATPPVRNPEDHGGFWRNWRKSS